MSTKAPDGLSELDPYDYELPPERIAQAPTERRDGSRLLVLDRRTGEREHRRFAEIDGFLRSGDLLVVNDTRVIPARLRARRASGGAVEVFLVEPLDTGDAWNVLARPGKAVRIGEEWQLDGAAEVRVRVVEKGAGGGARVELLEGERRLSRPEVVALGERAGETPLPPYIRRSMDARHDPRDRERYQTIWAREPGAVAAPTAGLHFSTEVLSRLESRGVERCSVTLHVGLDTFKPLDEVSLTTGRLHGERVEIDVASAERILEARREGRRVIAVGTTTARALESFAAAGMPIPYRDRTRLFIRPPYRFALVDGLVTNFHLPRSSLLMMVSAFAGREAVLGAYREAVELEYRFFSYGDAMLIV